mmetsp:Transcript_23660/g.42107  ORF Transcript_23660/g.42107 Transcript_23660/m.42107 type:complete len:367 (+) Transcript_23660:113-1213(+)
MAHVTGVDEQHLSAPIPQPVGRFVSAQNPQADRNLRRIEQLSRQGDHAIDAVLFDQLLSDLALAAGLRRHRAIGQHHPRMAARGEVVDDVLNPREVGVTLGRCSVLPTQILSQTVPAPIRYVERRVGKDVIGLEVRVAVFVKAARAVPCDVCVDAVHGKVHLGQAPCGVVDLLPVDGQVQRVAAVFFDELFRLNEHTSRPTAWVINAALVGLQHFNKRADHRTRREELAAALTLGTGKARDEVFIDAAQQVAGTVGAVVKFNVGEQIDQLTQHGFIERRAGVGFGQNPLEAFVGWLGLDRLHRVIDDFADIFRARVFLDVRPTGRFRHPKDVFGQVFFGLFRVSVFISAQLIMHRLKRFGNVFEED